VSHAASGAQLRVRDPPIIRWGEAIQQELSEGWSRVIQHDLTGKLDGHSWTVDFPVYIDCTYLNGKYDENGVARHGYAADAPFIDSPRDARYHYSKRFGIESSYRLFEQAIATTTTRDPTVRLLYVVVVSLLLQNVWRYLHYEYVATPRRGGRRLWWWPYKEFVNMIRRARGRPSRCVGPSPRIGHLTTDSTANHRPSKPAEVSGDASRRRLTAADSDTALRRSVRNSLVETVSTTASTQNSGRRNS